MPRTKTKVKVRCMYMRDLPQMMCVDQQCHSNPYTEDEFVDFLCRHNLIGIVASIDDQIVGFVLYERQRGRFRIHDLLVDPAYRRGGIARRLVNTLVRKLSKRRKRITVAVYEKALVSQLFFKQMKFRAVGVIPDYFEQGDAYLMLYQAGA